MRLFIFAAIFFLVVSHVFPADFDHFGKIFDTPRCAIGMTHYCANEGDLK
jgi:hypothetical protein